MTFDYRDLTLEHFDMLDSHEQERIVDSGKRLIGGECPRDFFKRIAPHEPPPRHLDPIIDVIEYARLKPVRAVFDMGPGHAKTTALCRLIAWWLSEGQSPGDLCAYLSYSDDQARSKSVIVRDAVEVAGGVLSADQSAAGHWHTRGGGGLVAKGAQGGVTGKRVPGLLVYDDPYKDMKEARSLAINSAIIERFKTVAFTRLQGGSIIVLHTRWHVDDLIGYILKNLKWDRISIPTICRDPSKDVLGRKKGEVAWPEKYPYEICTGVCGHDGHLKEIEKTLGPHIFDAMYQGNPRPEGTAVFHEPVRYRLKASSDGPSEFTWIGKRGCIAVDPAATAKTSADWSVIMACAIDGLGIDSRMWIVDLIRVQMEIPKLVQQIRAMQTKYRLTVVCEAIGGFKAVPQSLRSIDPKLRVLDIDTGGKDKYTRAMGLASAWNDGRVMVPMDVEWADVLIDEFKRFTGNGDTHDDQVDAGAHGWNTLYRAKPRIGAEDYADSVV